MSEYRKSKSSTEPSENLWRDKNKFEFLALMSVEECCYHLCQMETDRESHSPSYVIVDVEEDDNESLSFRIFKNQDRGIYRSISVVGKGLLTPEAESLTIVSGKVEVNEGIRVNDMIILVVMVAMLSLLENEIELMATYLIILVVMLIVRVQHRNSEQALIEEIYTVLGKQKD